MRAIVVPRFGGAEVLELVERAQPQPAANDILVRLFFAGVSYGDVYQREGTYRQGKLLKDSDAPLPIGGEGAGVVAAVGADVKHLKEGDRVVYADQLGSYAEFVAVPAWRAVKVPDAVSLRDAAAAFAQAATAHYLAFDTGKLGSDRSCVIHAAAGGVGHVLVQFAKLLGANVIATVGTPEKAAFVLNLGADAVIEYRRTDFLSEVQRLTNGQGVDVVYDSIGAATILRSIRATRTRGLCVLYGNSSGLVDCIEPMELAAAGSIFFTRPRLGHHMRNQEEISGRAAAIFSAMLENKLKVSIYATYPLDKAVEAHRLLQARISTGRILLAMAGTDCGGA